MVVVALRMQAPEREWRAELLSVSPVPMIYAQISSGGVRHRMFHVSGTCEAGMNLHPAYWPFPVLISRAAQSKRPDVHT